MTSKHLWRHRSRADTHFGGAPIILNTLINAKPEDRATFDHTVNVLTAGAPPSPATIKGAETLGFKIMQVYGLTETYGHVTECVEPDDWAALPAEERYAQMARVGVQYPMMEDIDVVDQDSRKPVPRDGKTIGEIVIRGNAVMKGYYKNPTGTAEAFPGGAFRSGDIAVRHPDGYIQITDRMKDIIISGGENISSVEVENTLMSHPAVSLCAFVARPDEPCGETLAPLSNWKTAWTNRRPKNSSARPRHLSASIAQHGCVPGVAQTRTCKFKIQIGWLPNIYRADWLISWDKCSSRTLGKA